MYGINFNKQDEKVEWLPLEYFDDSEYDELPSHMLNDRINSGVTPNF